jgi:molybdate transport system substrate-binding protein
MQAPFAVREALAALLLLAVVPLAACSRGHEERSPEASEEPAPKAQEKVTLVVSAASDLKFAFEELGQLFEKENPGTKVTFNFGSTGELPCRSRKGRR